MKSIVRRVLFLKDNHAAVQNGKRLNIFSKRELLAKQENFLMLFAEKICKQVAQEKLDEDINHERYSSSRSRQNNYSHSTVQFDSSGSFAYDAASVDSMD